MMTFRERRRVVGEWLYEGAGVGASCWQRRPQIAFRGLLVGRSLVEFALRYCQVLIELAKPRQI